jgi:DNA mismatch repair ATPase MutS
MTFDYRLRPGPCPTTNALKIMAAAGLPVPSTNGSASAFAPEPTHDT